MNENTIPNSKGRKDVITGQNIEETSQQETSTEQGIPTQQQTSSYPRNEETGCIKPCPRFSCLMTPSQCDKNCNQQEVLLSPCSLCDKDCTDHQKTILLRPEVKQYKQHAEKDLPKDFLYKSDVADRIVELEDKQEKINELFRKELKKIKNHPLPNFIAKKFAGEQLEKLKMKKVTIKKRIEELESRFE